MPSYQPGSYIDGRYEVASRPLLGGVGVVYVCFDHQEQRPVALKTFRPELLPDRAARDRFLREGSTWVALGRHPHIVRCHNVVRVGDGREVYLVLELVAKEEGRADASLRSWLAPGRPLPVEQALLFALQIARGIAHATTIVPGLVHRDLKPENVLVGADRLTGDWGAGANRLRITDFGLAQVLQEASGEGAAEETVHASGARHSMRAVGFAGGTPEYAAPEQWGGQIVDTRADIYALGCILTEMLTGRMPVQATPREACGRLHQAGRALQAVQELSQPIVAVLARCLAPDAGARYGNWKEVGWALAAAYEAVAGRAVPAPSEQPSAGDGQLLGEQWRAERVAAGWSYSEIGASYLDLGQAGVALGYFERARQAGEVEGERWLEGAGLGNLGLAYADLADARRAIGCYEQALAIDREICAASRSEAERTAARRGEGNALGNLGEAFRLLGEAQQAIGCYEQALALAREIGDRRGEGADLGNMGLAYAALGDAHRAIGYYEEALIIHREMGDRRGEGIWLGNLGGAHAYLGDARRAIGYYEQAMVIFREIGNRRGEGNTQGSLGTAYTALGDARRAIGCHEQQLAIACEIGDRRGEGSALGDLGSAYLRIGDARRAVGCYEQRLLIAREIGDRRGEGNALGNLGVAHKDLGDPRRAIGYYEQALVIRREISDRRGEANDLGNLGTAYWQLGDAQRAIGYYERQLIIARDIGDRRGEGNALMGLGNAYAQQGEVRRAIGYCEQALVIHREISDRQGEALSSWNLGDFYRRQGDLKRAVELMQICVDFEWEIGHPDAGKDAALVAGLRRSSGL